MELTRKLDAVLDGIEASLPEGVRINRHIFRQANFISVAIGSLLAALRDGALLVVLIVLAFLASGRATAITVLAIPLSCLTTIVAMKAFDPGLYELRHVASRVRQAMQDVPGVVDLAVEQQADIPFVTVKLKRAMIARYGGCACAMWRRRWRPPPPDMSCPGCWKGRRPLTSPCVMHPPCWEALRPSAAR